jgi:hypothetical protein
VENLVWLDASGPPVSEAEIVEVERQLGVKLPESYLTVVRLADGLRPDKELIVAGPSDNPHVVDALVQILRFEDAHIVQGHHSLLGSADAYGRNSESLRWVIPIAENGDGWICLDYRDDPSRVNYKVVGYSFPQVAEADADGLYPIADSFGELLTMLKR